MRQFRGECELGWRFVDERERILSVYEFDDEYDQCVGVDLVWWVVECVLCSDCSVCDESVDVQACVWRRDVLGRVVCERRCPGRVLMERERAESEYDAVVSDGCDVVDVECSGADVVVRVVHRCGRLHSASDDSVERVRLQLDESIGWNIVGGGQQLRDGDSAELDDDYIVDIVFGSIVRAVLDVRVFVQRSSLSVGVLCGRQCDVVQRDVCGECESAVGGSCVDDVMDERVVGLDCDVHDRLRRVVDERERRDERLVLGLGIGSVFFVGVYERDVVWSCVDVVRPCVSGFVSMCGDVEFCERAVDVCVVVCERERVVFGQRVGRRVVGVVDVGSERAELEREPCVSVLSVSE